MSVRPLCSTGAIEGERAAVDPGAQTHEATEPGEPDEAGDRIACLAITPA